MRGFRTIILVALAAVATMCSAPPSRSGDETEAAPAGGDEPSTQADEDGADEDGADEDGADEDGADEDGASTAEPEESAGTDNVPTTPSVSTEISFDLRGMQHRGPYDVDPRLIDSRRSLLMQRVRDAAGEPTPRVVPSVGPTAFMVEFVGPQAQALAQCQRVVAEVAPSPGPHASPRMAVRIPTATPCIAVARPAP